MYMKMRKIITCGEITKRKSIVQHPRGKKQPLSQGGNSMAWLPLHLDMTRGPLPEE
jgi:hypothetical protein